MRAPCSPPSFIVRFTRRIGKERAVGAGLAPPGKGNVGAGLALPHKDDAGTRLALPDEDDSTVTPTKPGTASRAPTTAANIGAAVAPTGQRSGQNPANHSE